MAHLAMNIVSNGGSHATASAAAAAAMAVTVDPAAVAALQDDVAELKNRLVARDRSVSPPFLDGTTLTTASLEFGKLYLASSSSDTELLKIM